LSLTLELFSNYLRASARNIINLTPLPVSTQLSLRINEVMTILLCYNDIQLPLLIKS
jgi:hypothetical protein